MGNIQRRKIKSRVSTRSRCENSFVYFHSTECSLTGLPQGGPSLWNQYISSPKGVLRILSYGGDRRIFGGGLKFSFPGFFGVGNFGKYFWGWPDLRRNVLEVFKTIERFVVLPAYPGLIVLRIKCNQTWS